MLAFDKSGNLYTVNCTYPCRASSGNTVTVYAAGKAKILRTISQYVASPSTVALDGSDNLYGANFDTSTVSEFQSGKTRLLRSISKGVGNPTALLFDTDGNLYVGNAGGNDVTVYTPKGMSPMRTISSYSPEGLVFDKKGNLYVANRSSKTDPGSVNVFAPNSSNPLRAITKGINNPTALTIEDSGDLYIANYGDSSFALFWAAMTIAACALKGTGLRLHT